jgi:heme-degrading monooxygenase HmoA
MSQITTLTFFRFPTFSDRFWAFQMMQFAHRDLRKAKGQTFYKLLGSGKGFGFNPLPDWSVYGLLQVWDSERDADEFFASSPIIGRYRAHTSQIWTLYLRNVSVKGEWSGGNPFQTSTEIDSRIPYLAVITRATIKLKHLKAFWKFVPRSQEPLRESSGLLFTKGIGEVPIVQMATFSLWENEAAMKEFAYKSAGHREAIAKTRELGWFNEEMFSRFQPFRSVGTWDGKRILDFGF